MRSALRTGMTLCVISLIFLAFNLVWAVKLPDVRWDFSQQRSNTLSPATLQLLTTLESPLVFYYFNSNKHTVKNPALKHYGQRVEEKLKAFEKAAKGRITLHIIDPAPFSEDAYKAGLYGLDDKQGFLGLIGTRDGGAAQRIESFSPDRESFLEYEISHLITRLLHPEPAAVGLLSGLPAQEFLPSLLEELPKHFDLTELVSNADHIPVRIKTLMLVHPRMLSEQTLYAVDQFVMGGGKLLVFMDTLSELPPQAAPSNAGLDGLLASWGITMPSNKVLVDSIHASREHPQSVLTLPRQAMNTDDVSTWKLNSVTVSSSGALFPLDNSRTLFTPLLLSSAKSALVDFDALDSKPATQGERHVIAARIEGPAESAFFDGINGQPPGVQEAAYVHVVVVADMDLLSEKPGGSMQPGNRLFVLNTLDNLAAPDPLANIRPHAVTRHSLQVLQNLREAAEQAYQDQARDLEQQLVLTENEWRRLNPEITALGTVMIDTSTQLQALNKERLRLPIELHALKVDAYAPVHRLERNVKLLVIVPVPTLLCLIAWGLYQWRHRRWPTPSTTS
ncbi:ABC transporter [Pseudomonas sp. S35]|uniref:Gldg family protein n=1 Tax=Pseudomonas sp. S35 TaxID=1573719 RepID=UPI00132E8581|nr:Gldg family protein [Pseudomonas sp. S35]QHF43892.1 ABC transporter [Pseudomonas sp. S35]